MSVPAASTILPPARFPPTLTVDPAPFPQVLVVDDEEAIRQVYREFLDESGERRGSLRSFRARAEAVGPRVGPAPSEVRAMGDAANQMAPLMASSGEEALELVRSHRTEARPIGVAFLDVKLGGGIDGLETASAIRGVDPRVFCTFVTAFTDRRLDEFGALFGPAHHDEWGYIHKPFTRIEVVQKARQQVTAWRLKRTVEAQTSALQTAHRLLSDENQLLERLVAARTVELRGALEAQRQATQRLDQLSRSQRTLLSVISHEMRTPLTIIQGNLELVGLTLPSPAGAVAAPLRDMAAATERLARLVNDTVLLTRERSVLPQSLPGLPTLQRLCAEAISRHRPLQVSTMVDQSTHSAAPGLMALDAEALARVLDRLLDNVAIHGGSRAEAWLTLQADAHGITLLCEDDGPGVPPDRLEEMFRPFVVGDETLTRADDRMGLGLAVARKLVADHGGTLKALRSPRGGLRLVLWLPTQGAPEGAGG